MPGSGPPNGSEDTDPLVPGAVISYTDITMTTLTVNWGVATDETTAQVDLQYKVVKASTEGDIDSVAEIDAIIAGDDLIQDWIANITSKDVTDLTSGTDYYFAVLVKDKAQNKELYWPEYVETDP